AGIAPTHHLHVLLKKAEAQNKPLETAVVIGNHTAVLLASQFYVDLGHDEYEIAGRLLGEPLKLVKCKSIDLEVPADAEIVLEGVLHGDNLVDEGPVSEFHGFYELYGPGNKMFIKTVTHRRNPVYQAILPGYAPEHLLVGGAAIGATTCFALKKKIPNVTNVLITEGGMGRLHAIISMHQPKAGEGKRAIMLAMGHTNLLKLIIVVDDDIDPNDWTQVEWALAARMRGEEDIMIIPGVKADRCDPLEKDLTITKVGIVATRKPSDSLSPEKFIPARAPERILAQVKETLDRY
ncbi:UbiD family decarboxylase, partial [Desulforhopalus singaporensis]